MKCIDCKWYVGQVNDTYGVCKRFPQTANKSLHDWCGEYSSKVVVITPVQIDRTEYTEDGKVKIVFTEEKPKRGRKPKQ
jgi:hypothetical protein